MNLRKPNRRRERGYSLIIAVGIIALLTMLGTLVLDQVYTDTQLAGGDRAAQNAMFLAEAGAIWGKQTLVNMLYPTNSGSAQVASIASLTPLPAADVICPGGAVCSSYYLLTPIPWVTYGNGQYRVAMTCSPNCTGTPISYTIRSIGKTPDGAARLVEIVVGQ